MPAAGMEKLDFDFGIPVSDSYVIGGTYRLYIFRTFSDVFGRFSGVFRTCSGAAPRLVVS